MWFGSRFKLAGFFPPFGFGSFFLRRGWDSVRHQSLLRLCTTLPRAVALRLSHPTPHAPTSDADSTSGCPCRSLRRGWDSNPRDPFEPSSFQDWCIRPLCHPSQCPAEYHKIIKLAFFFNQLFLNNALHNDNLGILIPDFSGNFLYIFWNDT